MSISPLAGKPAPARILVDIPKLISAYYVRRPDPSVREQRVSFGTSGHRGSSMSNAFNEWHILAITQAICTYRAGQGIDGPLYIGFDSHALSRPAFISALEVLAANGVDVMISDRDEYTPTPAISHAILTHNRGRERGLADGIVITPSHNPPDDGGFKYNPPHGGPAGSKITTDVQAEANRLIENGLNGVRRVLFEQAMRAATTHTYDYAARYVEDLASVLDMDAIRSSGVKLGVDPLGGAGIDYWEPIAERYKLDLKVVNKRVDYTFGFMTVDWDGKIRMDPSSQFAMRGLLKLKDKFNVAFACDADHDRHGIVTKSGLMQPNHYLAVCVDYLFRRRTGWREDAAVGKTVVSSSMIDLVTEALGRNLYEVPVGFKWFVDGLVNGWLGFGGEESAGASFLRRDGTAWSTDKDGMIVALLAAEITAVEKRDPAEIYGKLTERFGEMFYERSDAPATEEEKKVLAKLSPKDIHSKELAGDPIVQVLTTAPGDSNPIGGVKVITKNGWFAARPSGTEPIYKIYAESFRSADHLRQIQEEAKKIVAGALATARAVTSN